MIDAMKVDWLEAVLENWHWRFHKGEWLIPCRLIISHVTYPSVRNMTELFVCGVIIELIVYWRSVNVGQDLDKAMFVHA